MSVPTTIGMDARGNPIIRFDAIPNSASAAPTGPNAADYAQAGDGGDYALAINRAIAAAAASGNGAAVLLPPYPMTIQTPVIVAADNVPIIGSGRGSQLVAGAGLAGKPMIWYQGPATGFRQGAVVRDVSLICSGPAGVTGIQLDSTYYAVVERVAIEGVYATSIYLNGTSGQFGAYTAIRDCHLGAVPGGGGSAGIGILSNNHEHWTVDHCTINWFNGAGGVGVKCTNSACSITNTHFDECDTALWLFFCNLTRVLGNNFDRGKTRFIYLNGSNNGRIVGNDFDTFVGTGSQDAVYLDNNCADNLIQANNWQQATGWANAIHEAVNTGKVNYYSANDFGGLPIVRNFGVFSGNAPSGVPPTFNAGDFGAVGDGVTDNTTAIANVLAAANAAGGGKVIFGLGTFLTGPQTLYSNVYIEGAGYQATIIKLKAGSNADLFSAFVANINVNNTTSGNGSNTALTAFGLAHLTLDGNYSGQTAGPSYPLRFYGLGYTFDDIEIVHGYSGNVVCDYNGAYPGPPRNQLFDAKWSNCRIHDTYGTPTSIGMEIGGPTDIQWENMTIYGSNSHGVHLGPHAAGLQTSNHHIYSTSQVDPNGCGFLAETNIYTSNCEFETDQHAQLVLLSNSCRVVGGALFAVTFAAMGVQIGQQAGLTPYTNSAFQSAGLTTAVGVSSYYLRTTFNQCYHANGAIWFANDQGGIVEADIIAKNTTDALYSGTISAQTMLRLQNYGFSDPRKQIIQYDAEIAYWNSSGAPDPGNNGTISTAGLTISRVIPTANETGLILQPGTRRGQYVIVENLGAFTLTFAGVSVSHVYDGVSDVIPANCARGFIWDSANNAWLRLA